jgi:nucleotide-binding universal stress UspA family protein
MYKKILVPLDGTKSDEVVLEHVKLLVQAMQASLTLILLHRIAKSDDPFDRQVQLEDGSSGYRARKKAETYLPDLERTMRQEGIDVAAHFLIVEEPEADAIVKYAQDNGFDLIALTNRERSPVGAFFFGNIEEKVRRRSTLPVLFVSEARA